MILGWEDEAKAEFIAAAYYYEDQSDGLGDRFTKQIESVLSRILKDPTMPRCFEGRFRKLKAEKFPYFVIYEVANGRIQIMAVMHTSRRPSYWKSRLQSWE
jgi:toxin ParE1/3/4